jgi:homoserine O-acetyltransferase
MAEGKYIHDDRLDVEFGGRLSSPVISYQTWGKAAPDGSNVVWVCHALTANADVFDWWPGLFGEGELFNPDDHFIVCANILGSCYGTTGPASDDPETGAPYFDTFPKLTIRDLVKAHEALAQHLGIERINLLIGGSLGGQQALEWAIQSPKRFDRLVLLATNAVHSPWGVAFNEAQRMAIEADPFWGKPRYDAGMIGMRAARATALLSYRGYEAYAKTQSTLEGNDPWWNQRASSYQRYQGLKLAKRFNAWSYWNLSRIMDSHDVGRGRSGIENALKSVKAQTLVLGIESDILFPVSEQKRIADGIPGAVLKTLPSDYGHDGFLIETPAISKLIQETFGIKCPEPALHSGVESNTTNKIRSIND